MLHNTKFTLSDRMYPIECIYGRIEGLLWARQIIWGSKFGKWEKDKNRAP